jgi:acyl-CoA reductase-like NAD-dependent aldehyde dehydrogenase
MKNTVQRTVSPIDGSVLLERPLASDAQTEKALATAVQAQKKWRQVPVADRVGIVRKMVQWCVAQADTTARS